MLSTRLSASLLAVSIAMVLRDLLLVNAVHYKVNV